MKKTLTLILALCLVLCVCGCKSADNNNSSQSFEIEYQSVVVDENGNEITSSTQTTSSENNDTNTQSTQAPTVSSDTSSVVSSTQSKDPIVIDYDTVVEVDICDDIIRGYLASSDAKNQFYWLNTYSYTGGSQRYDNQYLSLDWYLDGSLSYTIYFSENADFSNAITTQTNSSIIRNTILIPGKIYYWKVTGTITSDVLGGGKIKVNDAPVRWIQIDGTGNVRDMGGWKTESGKTVKYGMLYRGQNIDNVSDTGIATIKQLGWKTELDLRYESQKNQKAGTGMNYVFLETSAQYDRIFSESYATEVKNNYKEIFNLLSDESNYPFYTHCSAGADRTGAFAFLTNGLLGVSYEDLTRDFELTSFSSSGKRWRADSDYDTDGEMTVSGNYVAWGKMYNTMMEDYGTGDGKLSSAIENYLINYIGIPQSQIDSFKKIMLG